MVYDNELANRVREQLHVEQNISEEEMFGGLAFLLNGNLAFGVSRRGGLLVQVGRQGMTLALSRPHTEKMVLGGRSRPGWVRVGPEGVRTTAQLAVWVRLGADVARALPARNDRHDRARVSKEPTRTAIADFDARALWEALDVQRRARGLSWAGVATELWEQSHVLNGRRHDHPISPSTIAHIAKRGGVGCHHALFMLRWLGQPPERFLRGGHQGLETPLPAAGPDQRLRWDLGRLSAALDAGRCERGLTWNALAREVGGTPSQLSGIRTLRFGMSMNLAMGVAQWLGRPAADFIYAAEW